MNGMPDRKVMKDLGLNDPVSVTLPVHVWLGFAASYIASDFNSPDANRVVTAIQYEMLDPLFIKEQEAHTQLQQDQAQAVFHHLATGAIPEVPPNMEEPQ